MAQKGVQLHRESFSCSVCLDLLKDPVTLPCGHSYCMDCIQGYWAEAGTIPSCPQCRQTFPVRPVLVKNTMLAALMEELKSSGLQAAPADHCYAGAEDVACDVCTGRKVKAFRSCLVCVASFCEQHLQPHYHAAAFQKHQLVEPSKKLQENMCSRHGEAMKMFCRTDQQCICFLCSVDEHRGHDTVSAAAERTERQRDLEESRQIIQQRIRDAEKDLELLGQEVENLDVSAQQTVEDCEDMLSQLIRLLQEMSRDVKQQVRSRQQTEASRVRELQEKLEQEIAELKRKDVQLEQLSHTEDHREFLLSFPSLAALRESTHSSSVHTAPLTHFQDVTAAVSEVQQKLQDILTETRTSVSLTLTEVDVLLSPPQPTTRAAFSRYSRRLTLDPDTAHTNLLLSEGNRKVTFTRNKQRYPQHPDRFTYWSQVLSRESLTGRCYWEVETRGITAVAVSYKNINRRGYESLFGRNDKSWALRCYNNGLTSVLTKTAVPGPPPSRVGVYLDHTAGILSFYSVSGTRTLLLHRVQTTFTQPLLAGVWTWGSAELVEVK